MGQPIRIDTEHPTLAPFVATLKDAELTRLTEAYQAADAHVRGLEARRDAAQAEIAAIDEQIVNLDAPATDKALTQRGRLSGLLAGLPTALARTRRERVLAHLAWLAAVRQRALGEAQRVRDELEPTMTAARDDWQAINDAELAKISHQISEADLDAQRAAFRARQAERHAQTEAARGRLTRAEEVAQVCELRAQQYGDEVRLTQPPTWEVAAANVAQKATPAGRSLVPA